jgi:nucleolar protein 12
VNVRVVRDRKTNVGKGFAYVSFADKAAVGLALKLDGTQLEGRPIRVKRCIDMRHVKEEKTKSTTKKRVSYNRHGMNV